MISAFFSPFLVVGGEGGGDSLLRPILLSECLVQTRGGEFIFDLHQCCLVLKLFRFACSLLKLP